MAKTLKIALGGISYEIPRLNLGQMEDLAEVWAEVVEKPESPETPTLESARAAGAYNLKMLRRAFAVADVVLRRAVPEIKAARDLECAPSELRIATDAILVFSDLGKDNAAGEAKSAGEVSATS